MLDFSDKPYQFIPPRLSPLVLWLSRQLGRFIVLRGSGHRVVSLSVDNLDVVHECEALAGNRLLFLPNHSTHSDPEIMTEVLRQADIVSLFMAAYEVFLRGRFRSWVIQRTGAFSVDRDGNDKQSLKTAVETLTAGHQALTIFPEGNVHLLNDRVMPFVDGAAYIALKAQQEIGSKGSVLAIPVAIKLTHLTNTSAEIQQRLERLAREADTVFDRDADIAGEVKRIGLLALGTNLRRRGYAEPSGGEAGPISAWLALAVAPILNALEAKMSLAPAPALEPIDRVRRARRAIHQIRIDPEQEALHAVAATWADEAILALRILSYAGDYLDQNPSLDRVGESVEKLLEDVTSKAPPAYGDRHAFIRFGTPIDMAECLPENSRKLRNAVQDVTGKFEQGVQVELDRINRENTHVGALPFRLHSDTVS